MQETVTPERTGWRDQNISIRHRLWGVACKATDIDFLLLEYHIEHNLIKPSALIEYKKKTPPRKLPNNMQITAITILGDRAQLPTFVVFYDDFFKSFVVFACNLWAFFRLGKNWRVDMSEKDFVRFLHKLRGIDIVPNSVWENIRKADLQQFSESYIVKKFPAIHKSPTAQKPYQLNLF